jgi:hypothetical protein
VIENWKNRLSQEGFKSDPEHRTSFVRRTMFLEQTIWEVKLRLEAGASNIRLGIGYTDKFMKNPFREIFLFTTLRQSELPQLNAPGKDWVPSEEQLALESLLRFGIPWLERFKKPEVLIDHFESHIKLTNAPGDHHKLSLLYYEMNQLTKACKHARAWLEQIATGTSWAVERARARRQLKAMQCPENKRARVKGPRRSQLGGVART